ncbi:MAG: hypothetical protein KF850_28885 [Labilithrix sp.]|nr:hypothetical protein [Labilithrix sp.]
MHRHIAGRSAKGALLVTTCALAAWLFAGCSSTVSVAESPDLGPGGFAGADTADGGDASVGPDRLLQCVATECPSPYTTCETDKPTYRCEINLMNDRNNCGACGVSCDDYEPIGMIGQCVQGKCDFQCMIALEDPIMNLKNCNGILDDGCEVDVYSDPMNCGVCGNECNPGDACIEGRCGCPAGFTSCNGRCVDLSTNDLNCGECGRACPFIPEDGPFAGCELIDKHAQAKCLNGVCGNLACQLGWGDCDKDMGQCPNHPQGAWSGCETPVTTLENCGACGNKCGPGQICGRVGLEIKCIDTCDKLGLTDCGSAGEQGGGCRDLNNDPHYCGSCVNACPGAGPHQSVTCNKGSCEYPCDDGYADCNGDLADGCEVNTMINPNDCGGCGVTCDGVLGQPCVEGKCLTTTCDEDGGVLAR